MTPPRPDRLRELLDTVLGTLDDGLNGDQVAGRAFLSRFHFDRLVSAGLGEAPTAFRRRLLLERAAWRLTRDGSVTDAGFQAGYGSTEAFSRAFSRAYGVSPSRFQGDFRLRAPNGIHFHAPAGLRLSGEPKERTMDLTDRLLEHDHWLTGKLLERAAGLTDEQLDRAIRPGHTVLSFDGPEPNVRAMLERLVFTKEVWSAAIAGRDFPETTDKSLDGLRTRWASAGEEFLSLVRGIRDRDEWGDVFVDALCEPPQSFTFGGVVAHVITFSAYRRQVLIGALAELGVTVSDPADPIEWERQRQSERPHPGGALRGTR
ncbi:MAG: helix-turn-helix domain-containing protein [Micromonosporaceae bacterium]